MLDALWLARWAVPPSDLDPVPSAPGHLGELPAAADPPDPGTSAPGVPAWPDPGLSLLPRGPQGAGLRGAPGPSGRLIRLPRAATMPHTLPLTRALRPLRAYRPPVPRYRTETDIERSVEAVAESGVPQTVERRLARRDLRLRLLMEATPSMVVWQDLLEELAALCTDTGAFREVRVDYLHPDGEQVTLTTSASMSASMSMSAARGPGRAAAGPPALPRGDTLGLLLSDCTGTGWSTGLMQRFLARWATAAPIAVLQPLPQRLWSRTRFPGVHSRLRRVPGAPGGLAGQPLRRRGPQPAPDARRLPVPVLEPTAAALGVWATLLAGPGTGDVLAVAGWVAPDEQPPPPAPGAPCDHPDELLARFRSEAAPVAYRLASYLASVPLWLPVMKVVQRAMLPDSEPADLAELLLSGLLVRLPDQAPWNPEQWYEFRPGIREALLASLARDEAELVQKHVSDWVGENFGQGVRSFTALLTARLGGQEPQSVQPWPTDPDTARLLLPFAQVSSQVVRRYLGPLAEEFTSRTGAADPAATAQALLARAGDRDGVRHVLAAVDLLREWRLRSDGLPQGPAASVELAAALVALWEETRDLTLLDQAAELLADAEAASDDRLLRVRALGLLGHVLHLTARVLLGAGAAVEARDRLLDADSVLLRTLSAHAADLVLDPDGRAGTPPDDWKLLAERAEVLLELWGLDHSDTVLVEAELLLRTLVERPGRTDAQRVRWRMLLGRTLLGLARARPGDDARMREAEEVLRTALDVDLGEDGLPRDDLAAALLDLAETVAAQARPAPVPEADEVLALLQRAVDAARSGSPQQARCLEALGRRYRQGHRERPAGWPDSTLADAAEAFDRARRTLPREHPEHTRLLVERGMALLESAESGGPGQAASDAVRVLRSAAAETGPDDPRYPDRLAALGRALAARHRRSGDLTDLREAEYVTERAAHGSWADSVPEAQTWFALAELRLALYRATGGSDIPDAPSYAARRWLDSAVQALRRTQAPLAQREDLAALRLAALAAHRLGEVAEALGRPRQALRDYREALDLLRSLPDGGGDQALDTRAAVDRLSG